MGTLVALQGLEAPFQGLQLAVYRDLRCPVHMLKGLEVTLNLLQAARNLLQLLATGSHGESIT